MQVGNELAGHEYATNTTADMIALAELIQDIWSDVAPAARPGLYGPSTDACTDKAQLEIVANISDIPGIRGFTFHSYPATNGTGPNSLPGLILNASWLRTGILGGSRNVSGCIDAWKAGPRAQGLELLVTEASSSYAWTFPPPAQDSVCASHLEV
jgi:hypothetical protein